MKKISLTQNKFALVDDENYEWLNQWKWYALKKRNTFYARRHLKMGKKQTPIYMHREILGLKHGDAKQVDHVDGDGLDNRRSNLRMCTRQQNGFNRTFGEGTSMFKGVSWDKDVRK